MVNGSARASSLVARMRARAPAASAALVIAPPVKTAVLATARRAAIGRSVTVLRAVIVPLATSRGVIASRVRTVMSVLVPPEPPPVKAVRSVRAATGPSVIVLRVETGPSAISRVAIAGRARTVMSVRGQPEALPARAAPSVPAVKDRSATSPRVTNLLVIGRAARALRPSPVGPSLVGPRVFPAIRKVTGRKATGRAATGLRAGRPKVVVEEKE
jgi:hypothetical protein